MTREDSQPVANNRRERVEYAIVVALGLVLFFVRFGATVLDPGQIDWLMARNDPSAYYLTWDAFRHDPWSFPLGHITSYLWPLGTSLPLVDGLPLFAYPAKFVAPLLPRVFQFFGFWLCLSSVLQGVFGYRIARRYLEGSSARIIAAALVLLAPTFIFREGHIALSGHWIILAAVDVYLGGHSAGWRRRWLILVVVAALVHPYLLAMVMIFAIGSLLRTDGIAQVRTRLVTGAILVGTIGVVWWLAGNFVGMSADRAQDTGFGVFSTNLNSFINPMNRSLLVRSLPTTRGQYEGYAYLGAGWLLLTGLGLVALAMSRSLRTRLRPHRALLVLLALTWIFALSNQVTWNTKVVAQYLLPPIYSQLAGVFRSSGRFVWPVTYAAMAGLLAVAGRGRPRVLVTAALGVALVAQVVDIRRQIVTHATFAQLRCVTRLASADWDSVASHCTAITTAPPFAYTTVNRADFRDICWLADQHRVPTTAGYTARMSPAAKALADSMRQAFTRGEADTTQLYIANRTSFAPVFAGVSGPYVASIWDGYFVCYDRRWPVAASPRYLSARQVSLADYLDARHDAILLVAVRDEATAHLTDADRRALRDVGIAIDDVNYRASLAAIVDHGKVAWQSTSTANAVSRSLAPGDTCGTFVASRAIALESAGFAVGNAASITIDGREESFAGRGFNILELDGEQHLKAAAWFDTHAGATEVVVQAAPSSETAD